MVGGNSKERSDISATLFPPTSATLLFHTFQIQRQRHRKRQIQSAYSCEATLLPSTSAATLLFHTFQIQRQRQRHRKRQSAYIFEATLLPPTSAATLLFHTFRQIKNL